MERVDATAHALPVRAESHGGPDVSMPAEDAEESFFDNALLCSF